MGGTRAERAEEDWAVGYLSCSVADGMFKGEKIASFTVGQRTISASVGADSIIKGKLLAVAIYGSTGDAVLIGLPGESLSSSRKLWIPKDSIQREAV